MATSPLLPKGRYTLARDFACHLGVQFEELYLDPLLLPGFVDNNKNRCYICKRFIYENIKAHLPSATQILDGSNVDDLSEDRPGRVALDELAIERPLLNFGLQKKNIRYLSKKFGLNCWDLPAESCLATRFPLGKKILKKNISLIDKVESFLIKSGYSGCRVFVDAGRVYLTVSKGQSLKVVNSQLAQKIKEKFSQEHFEKVFLDLSERPGIVLNQDE